MSSFFFFFLSLLSLFGLSRRENKTNLTHVVVDGGEDRDGLLGDVDS